MAKAKFVGFEQKLRNLGFEGSGPPLNVEGDKANEEVNAAAMEERRGFDQIVKIC